jgi:hypothetical protein
VVTVRHGWRLPAAKRDYNGDNAAGSTAPVILRLGVPVNLTSWAGVRPGAPATTSSGGRDFGETRKWLRAALAEAANAAMRTKNPYRVAQYARIKHRRRHNNIIVAIGHLILENTLPHRVA